MPPAVDVVERATQLLTRFNLSTTAMTELGLRLAAAGQREALRLVLEVLEMEAEAREQHKIARLRRAAQLPPAKTFDAIEANTLPAPLMRKLRELAAGEFLERAKNALAFGLPGVGKRSHLAIALGIKACEQGVRTLFVTAAALIATLGKAPAEGKLDERLKLLTQPQLLICDEIGYLPIDRQGANLFFQLVSRRYERGSIINTSKQSLGAWVELFGDTAIASAILDRLLHHSITINIKRESFRLKEKLKAGRLKSKLDVPPDA